MKEEKLSLCRKILDYEFHDPHLLELALTHPSCSRSSTDCYERLEFLGDSVLSLAVCTVLYEKYPELREGDMTKIKSSVVSRKSCAEITRNTGLLNTIFTGSEMPPAENLPESIAAAVFESITGAIYLDGGFETAFKFINKHMLPLITEAVKDIHTRNTKSLLQQYTQKEKMPPPEYVILDEKGPDHNKCFEIAVSIGNRNFPSAWGLTRKNAEQSAARLALVELGQIEPENSDTER